MNGHEAWVHQLGVLQAELDVVVGLPGRYKQGWDEQMRPLPTGATTCTLDYVFRRRDGYDCVVYHNITDLLDTRTIDAPKLLVLHGTLEGRMEYQGASFDPREMRAMLNTHLAQVRGHAIAISR